MNTNILLQLFGIAFIALGLAAILGLWQKWYWQTRGTVYSYIPLGCLFIFFSFDDQIMHILNLTNIHINLIAGLFLAIGLWWAVKTPNFLKPAWVGWVEKHPKRVQRAMKEAVMNGQEWQPHMKSEDDLDRWARKLKRQVKNK